MFTQGNDSTAFGEERASNQHSHGGKSHPTYRAQVQFRAGDVDARADRLAEGTVGVALLAAFVFKVPWLVPLVGLVLLVAAVAGTRANPFHILFVRAIAPRLGPPDATVGEDVIQVQDALLAAMTAVAAAGFALGVAFLGWLVVIAAAIVAALAAATSFYAGEYLRRLLSR